MITQTIIDDFHPVAKAIALMARSLKYGPQEYEGHTYNGIGLGYSPEMFYDFLSAHLGRKVTPKLEYFRLGTKEDSATTYIHADNACAKFAVVWYLSESPEGLVAGTAFWKHRASGRDTLQELDREDSVFINQLVADGMDESKWLMTGLCGQKFNRAVIYPTNVFHSRYPKEAWGSGPDDGRIVYTAFFD